MIKKICRHRCFAEWVLDIIWDEDKWDEYKDAFPELACRKLARMGYIKADGEHWVRKEKTTGKQK